MQIVQPLNSIAVRFLNTEGENVFVPDVIRAFQERYRFWKVPQTLDEYQGPGGAVFEVGLFGRNTINSFKLYTNGVSAETVGNTDVLDEFLDDLIDFSKKTFGLTYQYLEPVPRAYTSSLEVKAPESLMGKLGALNGFLERLTLAVAKYGFTLSTYQITGIVLQSDAMVGKPLAPGRFVFERRVNHDFGEGIFFSEAPVATREHKELLDLLESILTTA